MYVLRRVDTRQVWAGLSPTFKPKWADLNDPGPVTVTLFKEVDHGIIDDLDRLENVTAIFCPVTING